MSTFKNYSDLLKIKETEKETATINLLTEVFKLLQAIFNLFTEIAKYPNSFMVMISSLSEFGKWIIIILMAFMENYFK